VSGDVVLAKVLPQRVVLDNGGRYETLRLFEDSDAARQARPSRRYAPDAVRRPCRRRDPEPGRTPVAAQVAATLPRPPV
jgi:hypothetical protein